MFVMRHVYMVNVYVCVAMHVSLYDDMHTEYRDACGADLYFTVFRVGTIPHFMMNKVS
jgi:hypothetical protein